MSGSRAADGWEVDGDRRIWWAVAAVAATCGLAGCGLFPSGSRDGSRADPPAPSEERIEATGDPVDPDLIDATVDEAGRPYDATGLGTTSTAVRLVPVTELRAPGGRIRTSAGEMVGIDTEDGDPSVTFEGADRITVQEIRVGDGEDDPMDRIQGLRLDAPGAEVVRWRSFELAYGTDGGLGAVMSEDGHDRFPAVDGEAVLDALETTDVVALGPSEGAPDDLVVFANGYGDGGFPMSRGVDADGRTVSLVIWDTSFPWRLAVPDGIPPPDVSRIEDQLQECLDGQRDLIRRPWVDAEGTSRTSTSCAIEE